MYCSRKCLRVADCICRLDIDYKILAKLNTYTEWAILWLLFQLHDICSGFGAFSGSVHPNLQSFATIIKMVNLHHFMWLFQGHTSRKKMSF